MRDVATNAFRPLVDEMRATLRGCAVRAVKKRERTMDLRASDHQRILGALTAGDEALLLSSSAALPRRGAAGND
jgi:hypothetical protein